MIKDARRIDGLLALWQKDDKVWIELRPEDLNRPFFLSPKIAQGIGESGLFGGTVVGRWQAWGRPQIVEFRKVYNQVRLIARNEEFVAASGTPEARAVDAAFSDSLLGSAAVASLPHPDSKAVLIEANAIFLTDMLGLGINLQRLYRQGYSFDARNSAITSVRGMPDEVVLDVSSHFASAGLALPQPGGAPGAPVPTIPDSLPDARSMFLGLHYSLAKLPEKPMAPRRADSRVGYFTTTVQNFGGDTVRTPKQRYVNRWRLEKKEPEAALSEPVKPITFWLDRTIPLKYRDAITRGALEWNKAFEKIGFKDAVVVQVQPDDATFDTLDLNVASIRWMTNAQPIFGAIGPSHIDPRTGEILDADIGVESLSSRNQRAARAQILTSRASVDWPALMQAGTQGGGDFSGGQQRRLATLMSGHDEANCQHGDYAAEQLSYALDVLEARGEIDPDSPEAEAFVQAYLTDTTMHEVGHTLGLRHNFRSSRIYTDAQLSDPEFTRTHGLAGSVMEYAAINLALPGGQLVSPFQTTLGPYDYWAIEYAYKPLPPGSTPAQEEAELQRVAARSAEPELAYGTDEDNGVGIDPESLLFDLGNDPVTFAKKRIAIAQDLLRRQETRPLKPTEDYSVLRRALGYALRDAGRATGILVRQIGGLRTLRDFPGSGRDPLTPVNPAEQRDALRTLTAEVLAPGSFHISPALARKLGPDYMERWDSDNPVPTDFSLEGMVLDLQRALLNQLMSDSVAGRLLDAQAKADRPQDAMPLSEVYSQLTREVWLELGKGGDIVSARRDLQREYVNRIAGLLLRPAATTRADARSLVRVQARALLERIEASRNRAGLSAEARAHLADSAESLRAALAAPLQRSAA
ncbi:MAG TPA: zinc-dependent metalloprotease [Ideonella sp.]|nr:zinc-dependent metalloprotease [Ideonella sp.]